MDFGFLDSGRILGFWGPVSTVTFRVSLPAGCAFRGRGPGPGFWGPGRGGPKIGFLRVFGIFGFFGFLGVFRVLGDSGVLGGIYGLVESMDS
jgi:hypothetical protein